MKLINVITNEELKRPIIEEDFLTTYLILDSSDMAKIKWVDSVYRTINNSPFDSVDFNVNDCIEELLRSMKIDNVFIEISGFSESNKIHIQELIEYGAFRDADHINKFLSKQNHYEEFEDFKGFDLLISGN